MGRYVPFGPGEHSKMTEENTAVVEGKSVGKVSWRRGFLTSHTVGGRDGERERERVSKRRKQAKMTYIATKT